MSPTIYELSGTLTADSPLHIGADAAGTTTDLVQFIDGLGRVAIPGTSLAGALRAALGASDDHSGWGGQEQASCITVFDAHTTGDVTVGKRHGVAIDRIRGAAVDRHLYSREVVPAGTTFRLRILIETRGDYDADRAEDDLQSLVDVLSTPGFAVGASTSRGLGALSLAKFRVVKRRLDRKTLQRAIFEGEPHSITAAPGTGVPRGVVRVRVPWTPSGPVMSKVELDGAAADAQPLVEPDGSNARVVIPGSSVKGVLRSHAERIARTAAGIDPGAIPEAFLDQMKADGLVGVDDLFGLASDESDDTERGRRGVVTVHEVRSAIAVPTSLWDKVRRAAGSDDIRKLTDAVDNFNAKSKDTSFWLDVVTRNAIDRWTGGTADGRLYTTIEPHSRWEDMVLDINVRRLRSLNASTADRVDAALVLLLFVLIDACAGWLALGYGTTRGLGSFTVDPEQVTFVATEIDESESDHVADLLAAGTLSALLSDKELMRNLTVAWQAAIITTLSDDDNAEEIAHV